MKSDTTGLFANHDNNIQFEKYERTICIGRIAIFAWLLVVEIPRFRTFTIRNEGGVQWQTVAFEFDG